MRWLFHITDDLGDEAERYAPASLAREGFIHASREDQWEGVRDRYYADLDAPLVLLAIDTDLLDVPVVEEDVPGGETFPHVYGAVRPAAVVQVTAVADLRPESPGSG